MTRSRAFACEPESVPAARRFVRDALRGEPGATVDAAELMACELVTNCIRHARTGFEVAIDSGATIRVAVSDTGGGHPHMKNPPVQAPSGRGLRIVDGMSDEWGVSGSDSGKTVWFTLTSQRGGSGAASGAGQHAEVGAVEARRARTPSLRQSFRRARA